METRFWEDKIVGKQDGYRDLLATSTIKKAAPKDGLHGFR